MSKHEYRRLLFDIKVLEDLCLENCGKRSTAEIERWAKGLALLPMLDFLKPFFQYCTQDIRLHTRLELFSGNLRDIMLETLFINSTAVCNRICTVPCKQVAQVKKFVFSLNNLPGTLVNGVFYKECVPIRICASRLLRPIMVHQRNP